MSGARIIDPYIDPISGDLRTLLAVSSLDEFKEAEAQVVFANELELESAHIPRTNDLDEVCAIHEQLFKGVYDWAGKPRVVDLKKNMRHAEFFLIHDKIVDAAYFVFGELASDHYLQNLDQDTFASRLAYFYDQLNYIHPFREGNGRTQRVFWSRVARDAGYEIAWNDTTADENNEACKVAMEENDTSQLIEMFRKIVHQIS